MIVQHHKFRGAVVFFLGLFATCCTSVCGCGHSGAAANDAIHNRPITSINAYHLEVVRDASKIGPLAKQELAFLDNKRLLLATMFSSVPESLLGKELKESVTSNLALAVLDANSGQIRQSRQWLGIKGSGIVADRMLVVPDLTGGAFLGMDCSLLHLSSKLVPVARRSLEANAIERNGFTYRDSWVLSIGFRGETALLSQTHPFGGITDHWISPATLKDEESEAAPDYASAMVVGTSVVFQQSNRELRHPYARMPILVRQRKVKSHALCAECFGIPAATFGNRLIFIKSGSTGSFLVADLDGKVLYSGPQRGSPSRNSSIGHVAGASHANRVAFTYGPSTFVAGRPMNVHIAILDADLKKEIWDEPVEIRPERVGNIGIQTTAPLLALSPDGHTLAIIANGLLEIFQIA